MSKGKKTCTVIVLDRRLITSTAWLGLSGAAKSVFLLFRTKCCMDGHRRGVGGTGPRILNNGEITFSYKEAETKYGITRPRFRRAIDDLIDKGFLSIAKTGCGYRKLQTWYSLDERWRWYGTPEFQPRTRPSKGQYNFGFAKGNELWKQRKENVK